MSEPQNPGCSLWAVFMMLVVAISGIFYSGAANSLLQELPLPRSVPVDIPRQEASLPFTLQGNRIIYTHKPTLGDSCNHIIQGRILDSAGQPVTNVRIYIERIEFEEVAPLPPAWFSPSTQADANDTSWGMLVTGSYSNLIWLTDTDGQPISPKIYVSAQDCNHNVATLIFAQKQPPH